MHTKITICSTGAERDTSKQNILDAALDYARRGWPVFPCKPTNKAPLHQGRIERGNDRRGDDPQLVAALAARHDRRADGIAVRRLGGRSRSAQRSRRSPTAARIWAALIEQSMASCRQRTPRLRRAAGNTSCSNGTRTGR